MIHTGKRLTIDGDEYKIESVYPSHRGIEMTISRLPAGDYNNAPGIRQEGDIYEVYDALAGGRYVWVVLANGLAYNVKGKNVKHVTETRNPPSARRLLARNGEKW